MKRSYKDLTLEEVSGAVIYKPASGEFLWAASVSGNGCGQWRRAHVAGAPASRKAANGYRAVTVNGAPVLCHRLAWFIQTGKWPSADIDHKNGVRDDNRFENLREVSRAFNMQNLRRSHVDSASQMLGAYFDKRRRVWTSSIAKGGKTHYLGVFESAESAHSAYLTAKRALHEACTL